MKDRDTVGTIHTKFGDILRHPKVISLLMNFSNAALLEIGPTDAVDFSSYQ